MKSNEFRRRTAGLDRPVALALVSLLLVYCGVTFVAYEKISRSDGTALPTLQREVKEPSDEPIKKLQQTFPIHVGPDTEVITHPGLSLQENPPPKMNIPRTITVPKFFDESHGSIYGGSIRAFLGNGERLMTPQEASKIGSFHDGQETIFCSIASYRDPECTGTVEDIYARAKYPERLRVSILDQRVEGDSKCAEPAVPCEQDPDQSLCKYRHLIDVMEMDAQLAVGPVFARHIGHRHYRGEYFAMQIDSHVRFIEHWDDDMVNQWKSAHNEMAILTTYLSDLNGSIDPITHESKHPMRPIMCASDYEGNGAYKHLRHGQQPEGPAGIKGQPTLHPFWAAGFSFARGHFVIQVPYDQYLPMVFQGEEISIGLRGFTYGYDYYAPERNACFHMYAIKENAEKRKKVPLFWENSRIYKGVGETAMKRLNNIIGTANDPESEWPQDDKQKYGLGTIRDKETFYRVFGIHTETQTVEHHLCRFVGKPMMRVFLPALRSNGMGLDYTKINYEFKDPAPNDKAGF